MKCKRLPLAILLLGILAGSCKDTPSANSEPGLLSRTDSAEESKTQGPIDIPSTGEGNFESLVADYESKDRVIWQKPSVVISVLGDLEGKTVADIGAGTGYFAFRLVRRAKKVIAIDIDPRFITFMDSVKVRLQPEYRDRFESRLSKPDDPFLAPEEVDAIVIVNTYGYLEDRAGFLDKLWEGLKPEGQLLIIDFKKNNLPVGPQTEYKVSTTQAQKELSTAGFVVKSIDRSTLDYQYIIQAIKKQKAEE